MTIPPFKVAYMEPGRAKTLYSNMFDTEQEARDYAAKLNLEGKETLLMRAVQGPEQMDDVQFYEWKLLDGGASFKYRLGIFITSPKFVVPLVLAVIAYLLLKRNGLPKVIG